MSTYERYAFHGPKAAFTMTLGEIIAAGWDTDEKLHLDSSWYPLYDETHRAELNEKIIAHFALREIGFETVEMFVYKLGVTMRENAPYFNTRYKAAAALLAADPLSTVDTTTTSDSSSESQSSSKADGSQDSSSSTTSDARQSSRTRSKAYDSDVPATGVVDDFARYASHASESEAITDSDSTTSQQSSSHATSESSTQFAHDASTGEGVSHTAGRMQSGASLAREYADAVLNVDMEVITALETLFMQIAQTRDTIFGTPYERWEYV